MTRRHRFHLPIPFSEHLQVGQEEVEEVERAWVHQGRGH